MDSQGKLDKQAQEIGEQARQAQQTVGLLQSRLREKEDEKKVAAARQKKLMNCLGCFVLLAIVIGILAIAVLLTQAAARSTERSDELAAQAGLTLGGWKCFVVMSHENIWGKRKAYRLARPVGYPTRVEPRMGDPRGDSGADSGGCLG